MNLNFQMLKVLVDNAYQLTEPHPNTLFCLLEYDGNRLTTSHNQVQGGRVRYNEEAEFSIKKPGNLRIQLCSVEGKPGLLSLEVNIFTRFLEPTGSI